MPLFFFQEVNPPSLLFLSGTLAPSSRARPDMARSSLAALERSALLWLCLSVASPLPAPILSRVRDRSVSPLQCACVSVACRYGWAALSVGCSPRPRLRTLFLPPLPCRQAALQSATSAGAGSERRGGSPPGMHGAPQASTFDQESTLASRPRA